MNRVCVRLAHDLRFVIPVCPFQLGISEAAAHLRGLFPLAVPPAGLSRARSAGPNCQCVVSRTTQGHPGGPATHRRHCILTVGHPGAIGNSASVAMGTTQSMEPCRGCENWRNKWHEPPVAGAKQVASQSIGAPATYDTPFLPALLTVPWRCCGHTKRPSDGSGDRSTA
jgi:hypothetical protein